MISKLVSCNIVKYGNYTLKSGIISDIYINFRNLISYPSVLTELCLELGKMIPNPHQVVVAGVAWGGIPLACQISTLYNIPMILIRETAKEHGLGNIIEGESGNREVILIDDVITTGSSLISTIKLLNNQNLRVGKIITVVDREVGGGETIRQLGYDIISLYKLYIDNNKSQKIKFNRGFGFERSPRNY